MRDGCAFAITIYRISHIAYRNPHQTLKLSSIDVLTRFFPRNFSP